MSKVAVIGGGAAGMMAAYAAGKAGHEVTLFDHNEKIGKKLYITGKGRCNLTNACEREELFSHFSRNDKFLYSAVSQFDNQAVMDFFKKQGLRLKTERGERVFPVSDHSSDVIKTLDKALASVGVKVKLNTLVAGIQIEGGRVSGVAYTSSNASIKSIGSADAGKSDKSITRVENNLHIFNCDAVIIATGGRSYPSTGSDGSGYDLVKKLGHTVTELRPSLVGFNTAESYIPEMQGLSLKNINFTVKDGRRKIYSEFGELLFTHKGISGPVVISASSLIPDECFRKKLSFEIDLKPAMEDAVVDIRIQNDLLENSNRAFRNSLGKLLPSTMIPVMVKLSGIDPEKRSNSVTKKERKHLVELFKHFPGTITGLGGWDEAIITRGGVDVKEVDPSTMESKLVKGLFICGEMLDVDALTGGFNLQIAWSTGHLAGSSVV
ncbi:MAG: NAD(P)/FAD-dependent oxidoreductase [Clostridiales bacterium]|nr:NAD(P)/FAD-dependent oxidoreductase [Clostridiales bacterium]